MEHVTITTPHEQQLRFGMFRGCVLLGGVRKVLEVVLGDSWGTV